MSVAQVAGSAFAAVAAAVLASKLGVYGTILGAGVVSVVATAGGSVFQHLFRRTGEQLKEATAQARPRARGHVGHGPGDLAATHATAPDGRPGVASPVGEYGAATTHGTRLRGWRRPALAAGTVFVLAMGTVTGIEMFAGGPVSNVWGGDHGGTTVGNSVGRPGKSRPAPDRTPVGPSSPSASPHTPATGGGDEPTPTPSGSGGRDTGTGEDPAGGGGHRGGEDGTGTATPTPAPSGSGEGSPDPSGGDGGTAGVTPATPTPPATGEAAE